VRGISYFLFVAALVRPMFASPNMGHLVLGGSQIPSGPAPLPAACELVEQGLRTQLQMAGGDQMGMGMEMQVRMTRVYRELARRACIQNRTYYAIQYRAALETAWAILDIQFPMPYTIETDEHGRVTDPVVLERRRLAAELREIERAPVSQGW